MRVADKMAFEQVKSNIAKNRTQMAELQNEAATQMRVTKPSDDPLAASRVLTAKQDLSDNKQFSKSLGYAKSFLDYTDESLADISDALMRTKELALGQANDASSNPDSRRAVATEVDQLYDQLVQIGNRKLGDRFIFGGYRTQKSPFKTNGSYSGDMGEMMIHVDKDSFVPMNIPGAIVFLGQGISKDGATVPAPEQARTIEQWDQEKWRQMQKSAMPNSSEIPQGQDLRGPASVKGGSAPEALQDGGGVNIFDVLKDLSISLRTDDKKGIQDSLDRLDQSLSQVVLTRAQVGSRSTALENFISTMGKAKVDDKVAISNLQDADIFSTVSDINKTQSTLQATLQTSGKLIQPSLLDFLR